MRSFTNEQESAITTRNCDLLISAAAGSGKTAVLIERIIRLVLNPQNPTPVDRLLVVTFTEAAAREMRSRLEEALAHELECATDNQTVKRIENQIMLLSKAMITTIHSFCLKIVRRHFNKAEVDPMFRIADTAETDLLKTEVIRGLFEELYDKNNTSLFVELFETPHNDDFIELVEAFGDKVRDDSLQRLILHLYHFSQSHPFPERFLKEQSKSHVYESIADIESKEWYAFFISDAVNTLNSALAVTEQAINISNSCPFLPEKNMTALLQDRKNIENAIDTASKGLEDFYNAMQFSFLPFAGGSTKKIKDGSFTNEEVQFLRQKVKKSRDEFIKKPITNMQGKIFVRPFTSMLDDCNKQGRLIYALCAVTIEFSKRFQIEKRQKNIADFNDLEHLCLKILVSPESTKGNVIVTKIAEELREYFAEVMVDEYQDSNLVQEMILTSVSKRDEGKKNMFMVGDAKQSIYKFRLADPSIFMDKYDLYSNTKNICEEAKLITLSKNFRSRSEVIDSVNYIFLQLMSKEVGEIDYNSRSMLYTGATYPEITDKNSAKTELLIMDTSGLDIDIEDIEEKTDSETDSESNTESDNNYSDNAWREKSEWEKMELEELTTAELEAKLTANRIKELFDDNFEVRGSDGKLRPLRFSDIAILLRSPKASAETFTAELKRRNIPSFSEESGSYFEAAEVLVALSFFKIIDNPLQDIPLLSVLRSPVYAFNSDELVEVRNADNTNAFYLALKAYVNNDNITNPDLFQKINGFLNQLERFRELAAITSVNELIWIVYNETGYYNYTGAMEGGTIRQANLTALFHRAVEFEKTSLKGLFHFIKYIERLQSNLGELGTAKVANENADLVRIMSIHKSKGLEFPVVFVCGLNKKFNLQDMNSSVVMHQNFGMASFNIDTKNRLKSNTLPRYTISRKILRENLSEELRVLYVALTRAKEKLILTGAIDNPTSYLEDIPDFSENRVDAQYIITRNSYLKWILAAISNNKNEADKYIITKISTKGDTISDDSRQTEQYKLLLQKLRDIDTSVDYSGKKDEIYKKLSYVYNNQLSVIPAKLSVSEIKRRFDRQINIDSVQFEESYEKTYEKFYIRTFRKPSFLTDLTDSADSTDLSNKFHTLTSAEKGTIMHTVMEHIPFDISPNMKSLNEFLLKLQRQGILSENEVNGVDKKNVLSFLESETCNRIKNATFVKREARFIMGINPSEIFPDVKISGDQYNQNILVHGIIDCLFEENGKFVIIDYKTDKADDISEYAKKYEEQMRFYKLAVEKSFSKPVAETILYFFAHSDSFVI